ncbi:MULTISPECIES: AGE family epimerase/isomerase [Rhodopseudomonas]|uniref:Mannose-6-phosphate isomerase n=1 Tax=Rhodopseudomonas palustris TaxID=1076 RepID=A0A0D7EXV8_RHOPL|nr:MULTISPECIES: AGE family epimerase/isomerase [Rhodopseudomonas]KIZ45456.1 mannose-6-phosphate isomerase [Rhodopseudomonas palustris]MDF3810004.1 AGE family epimerase/isomerase [Rhodopseudomonas sp. BAL398]WOK20438.1 AGE family epimerase/isomerase [Rhodopseudomonas sp. BAL398]
MLQSFPSFDDREIVGTLKTLVIDHSLPLWAGEGWDAVRGGFVERLDKDGKADRDSPRRVRVQARQIYCFAKAARLGWYPEGRTIALKGLDYLLAKAKSPDGRPAFVHLLAPDGAVLDPLRDCYDHAFVLLALSSVYALDQDAQVRAEMDALLDFLDRDLRSPHGGFVEGVPASMPRRQNPQMHLFEAMIAAFDATKDSTFQERAGELFGLFVANLYDQRQQVLGEYFEDDWSMIRPVCVEPGHQAEWVWLLQGFERISGCPTGRFRSALLQSALRYRDGTGCLVDAGDAEGRITNFTRRCWPQTEIAKAWLAQAAAGEQGAHQQAIDALARLHRHYLLHPVAGGWHDQFDGDGRSLVDFIPASTFYHVLCAVSEADQCLSRADA